ncbi:MAG TPA: radical SAM protein [Candidatus Melainabacteria bacterium]|nr:radical SAM protein [Candidatus Melainabacteria bacterium]
MLRLSRFTFLVAVNGVSENWLIYNALTDMGVLVDSSIARPISGALKRGPGRKPFWRYEKNTGSEARLQRVADSLPAAITAELRRLAILVDPIKEELCIDSIVQDFLQPSCLKLTIAYTARCQMACGYCFQSGRDKSRHHDQNLIDETIAWAETYIRDHGLHALHLGLFGGEPLADYRIGLAYARGFKQLTDRLSIPLEISLTTNGLNLSNEILTQLRSCGLTYVRVTLDGPPSIHDLRRPTNSGGGSFDRILANLKKSRQIDGFGIGVAVNVDETTSRSIGTLLEILHEAELKEDVEIILEPVMPQFSKDASERYDSAGQLRYLADAFHQVVEKQFASPLLPGMCGSCNVIQKNCFVVDWNGDLFRCSFTMLEKGMSCGSVCDGFGVSALTAAGNLQNNFDRASEVLNSCQERQCPYLSLCGGGCRFQSWLADGDWAAPSCPEKLFNEIAADAFAHSFDLKTRRR